MEYLAHSSKDGAPSQLYSEHVEHVAVEAAANARAAANAADGQLFCCRQNAEALVQCVSDASEYHDLGKLTELNQAVLRGIEEGERLPVNHADAGAAALLKLPDCSGDLAALLVYSHHRGLPDMQKESLYPSTRFRDKKPDIRKRVNAELDELLQLHNSLLKHLPPRGLVGEIQGSQTVFCRMALSCLADADHTDTATHYNKYPRDKSAPPLRAKERRKALDAYISSYTSEGERNQLRREMYWDCRNAGIHENIAACNSPVGSGKTTAVMAHLLSQAIARGARRIFVVLPFTNIITQSVDVYRKALVLPGENPEDVVAEIHHKAEFQDPLSRAYSIQWRAPIIVTTAVAFFETLGSNRPSALRRLHELPGSVIFVDEAHAAMPIKLLPLAWQWMQILADEWSCYWLLASGSLVEFWKIEEIAPKEREVPQIVSPALRDRLSAYEQHRIRFSAFPAPVSCQALYDAIKSAPGPRIVIVNTVQSAAVLAAGLLDSYGSAASPDPMNGKVMHLSTALSAEDRERTVQRIKDRLQDCKEHPTDAERSDWALVATSCVEAGVDFSFHSGFRELSSLLSLLQAAGRVGRNGEYPDAEIKSFKFQEQKWITQNPAVEDARSVLESYFEKGREIGPHLCTGAIRRELSTGEALSRVLMDAEENQNYEEVCQKFKLIPDNTVLVVADESLKQKLRFGQADWREIQRKAIPMRIKRVRELSLQPLTGSKNDCEREKEGNQLYDWNLRYDPFLGVMAGILDVAQSKDGFLDK